MASPEKPSKRERQKQRREVKLAQQRAEEAKARRNRLLVFAALGVIFVGLVGLAVWRQQQQKAAEQRDLAAAEEIREELGCTPDEVQEDLGGGHLDGSTLAEQPPDALYPDRPASSGQHIGNWVKTGVYDVQLDERLLVHNLEHGYVVAHYGENAPDDQVAALKEHAQAQIDGKYKKLIVAPWEGELPDGKNFAYTGWTQRQACEEFDDVILDAFLVNHHSGEGVAPEKGLSPHLEAGQGTIDPEGEPVLLPPLGEQAVPDEGTSEGGADPASEEPAEDSS